MPAQGCQPGIKTIPSLKKPQRNIILCLLKIYAYLYVKSMSVGTHMHTEYVYSLSEPRPLGLIMAPPRAIDYLAKALVPGMGNISSRC